MRLELVGIYGLHPICKEKFQLSAYWLRLHVSIRPVIEQYVAPAMMQFARRDPYKEAASKAFTHNGFIRSRSYLFGISFSSPSQPWRVNYINSYSNSQVLAHLPFSCLADFKPAPTLIVAAPADTRRR